MQQKKEILTEQLFFNEEMDQKVSILIQDQFVYFFKRVWQQDKTYFMLFHTKIGSEERDKKFGAIKIEESTFNKEDKETAKRISGKKNLLFSK